MALSRNRRSERTIDYWPGFVDALSTLLLAIMFLLSVFVLAQFLLTREISGKDAVLDRLNSQINELTADAGARALLEPGLSGPDRDAARLALFGRGRALAAAEGAGIRARARPPRQPSR